MSDQQDPRKEQYERARDAFEALDIEDRTLFLVREAVNTIAAGVDTFARQLATDLDAAFRPAQGADEEAPDADEKPDAEKQPKAKTTKTKGTTKKNGSKTSAKKKSAKASGDKKTKEDKDTDQTGESEDEA